MTEKTMSAVTISAYGDSEVLELRTDCPQPSVGANDVLIKVYAAGVNPVDWKIRKGYLDGMLNYSLPFTLGWDVAGEIVALGSEVSGWKIGDAVYSRPNIERNGAYAQYIAVDVAEIAAKPQSLSWQEAAAVPLAALTAWQALFDACDLQAGEKVLIHAGSGGVGHLAIQLAKLKGAYVITTASKPKHDYVKSLGADEVIDYQNTDFSTLRELDVVFDTLGGQVLANSWQTLKAGGRLVSIIEVPDEATAREHKVASHFVFVQPSKLQLDSIAKHFDEGKLTVTLDSTYPLFEVKKAHERSESGRAKGKIVLTVAD